MILPPAQIWRLSKHRDISGRGGLVASGRWHTFPKPVVYCSDAPYTAFAEVLSLTGSEFLMPGAIVALRIQVPAGLSCESIDESALEHGWANPVSGWLQCQPYGDDWLKSCRTPLLRVPCAVRPESFNYLINPVHRDADFIKVVEVFEQPFPDTIRRPPTAIPRAV